jgi:hypothetical protein
MHSTPVRGKRVVANTKGCSGSLRRSNRKYDVTSSTGIETTTAVHFLDALLYSGDLVILSISTRGFAGCGATPDTAEGVALAAAKTGPCWRGTDVRRPGSGIGTVVVPWVTGLVGLVAAATGLANAAGFSTAAAGFFTVVEDPVDLVDLAFAGSAGVEACRGMLRTGAAFATLAVWLDAAPTCDVGGGCFLLDVALLDAPRALFLASTIASTRGLSSGWGRPVLESTLGAVVLVLIFLLGNLLGKPAASETAIGLVLAGRPAGLDDAAR